MDAAAIAEKLKEVLHDRDSEQVLEALCMSHCQCVTIAVLI